MPHLAAIMDSSEEPAPMSNASKRVQPASRLRRTALRIAASYALLRCRSSTISKCQRGTAQGTQMLACVHLTHAGALRGQQQKVLCLTEGMPGPTLGRSCVEHILALILPHAQLHY
jgi:hypothetical protein